MTTQYQTGDYVRIRDHDGSEINVKITDSGIPNRQGDFTFKAGARMFKNSEILGLGEVPVVSEKKYEIGDRVKSMDGRHGFVGLLSEGPYEYRVDLDDGDIGWYREEELFLDPTPAPDTEVHADLAAETEAVKHPAHYGGDTTYKVIKVITAWGLGFDLGNVTKYVARAGKKDPAKELEDLRKARFYLNHRITQLEQS